MKKRGFTLIELIVVMSIIGVLIVLATPKYLSYRKDAELTRVMVNLKELETACEKYYMTNNDWPRLSDDAYTKEELMLYSAEIYEKTGLLVDIDETGNYYALDYKKLGKYIKEPTSSINYILQNPVGSIYYLKDLTSIGKEKLSKPKDEVDVVIPTDSRVLHYSFVGKTNNDLNRGIINDLSGNGNDATLVNFDFTSTSGWVSDGLMFNGSDYVRIPLSANIYTRPSRDFSVTVDASKDNWVVKAEEIFISSTHDGGWNIDIYKGSLIFKLHNKSKYVQVSVDTNTLSPGRHIITSTFDGRYLKLYVDGILRGTTDLGTYIDIHYTYNNNVLIGADAGAGSTVDNTPLYFKGQIHNISMYNTVLTDEIIRIKDRM